MFRAITPIIYFLVLVGLVVSLLPTQANAQNSERYSCSIVFFDVNLTATLDATYADKVSDEDDTLKYSLSGTLIKNTSVLLKSNKYVQYEDANGKKIGKETTPNYPLQWGSEGPSIEKTFLRTNNLRISAFVDAPKGAKYAYVWHKVTLYLMNVDGAPMDTRSFITKKIKYTRK